MCQICDQPTDPKFEEQFQRYRQRFERDAAQARALLQERDLALTTLLTELKRHREALRRDCQVGAGIVQTLEEFEQAQQRCVDAGL